MASSSSSSKKLLMLILLFSSSLVPASSPSVGVSFNPSYRGLPSGDSIVSALGSAGVTDVLLSHPDPQTLRSFLYTNISLLFSLSVPLPLSRSSARQWLSTHLLPFHPRIHVTAISLVLPPSPSPTPNNSISLLLSSLQTLHSACADLGLPKIPVSTVHRFDLLMDTSSSSSFPPSAARFQANLLTKGQLLVPLLEFLSSTGAPFLVDISPFHLCRTNPAIPIGYALFKQEPFSFRDDPGTGLRYRNLFDAMVDAVFAALEGVGYGHLPLVVTGPGWPSQGDKELATAEFACSFNRGLLQHLRSGLGTPMRREGVKAVYVRELFDDLTARKRKNGTPEWERHWGVWFANLSHKYEMDFSSSAERGRWVAATTMHAALVGASSFLSSIIIS